MNTSAVTPPSPKPSGGYELVRLGYVARLQNGLTVDAKRDVTGDVVTSPYLRVANVQAGSLDLESVTEITVPRSVAQRCTLRPGDVLMTEGGDLDKLGRGTVWQGELDRCLHQNHIFAVRPDPQRLSGRFLAYVTQSLYGRHYFESTGTRTTNLASTNSSKIQSFPLPLPPLNEQHRIADFLDGELGKLNDLVAKKLRLVSLMDERIDSRVLQHVRSSKLVHPSTGGPVLPIRRALTKVTRPAVSNAGVITAYRDGQVTERSLRRAEGYTLSASTDPQGQHVQVGDIVVHGLDGFAGAIGTSEAVGNCSPVYHVCVPNGDNDARFMGRLLRLLALQGYLGNFATSTRERAVDFRNWDLFGRIPIPVVPPDEQREIGTWITRLRPLRELIARSVELATERRQALITAAVTGQFDVSTASGRNVTDGVTA
ncbi:restriction endonuclease subunit S [Streptomyces sp. Li-HN-5-11]|uniref:restriction endonuclease subunit S n=1 Tax=Streptomyces sp. Li-HN-5-11 TaxID=3075432 RepID=UPI0028AE9D15|nr:restriction endonuclease subunit S [Streptomyces sp. Li-HN-5-11]WNM35802.1 restriction endonuclease subunit S [Streptomyces sp. Li-HN-5-11]